MAFWRDMKKFIAENIGLVDKKVDHTRPRSLGPHRSPTPSKSKSLLEVLQDFENSFDKNQNPTEKTKKILAGTTLEHQGFLAYGILWGKKTADKQKILAALDFDPTQTTFQNAQNSLFSSRPESSFGAIFGAFSLLEWAIISCAEKETLRVVFDKCGPAARLTEVALSIESKCLDEELCLCILRKNNAFLDDVLPVINNSSNKKEIVWREALNVVRAEKSKSEMLAVVASPKSKAPKRSL